MENDSREKRMLRDKIAHSARGSKILTTDGPNAKQTLALIAAGHDPKDIYVAERVFPNFIAQRERFNRLGIRIGGHYYRDIFVVLARDIPFKVVNLDLTCTRLTNHQIWIINRRACEYYITLCTRSRRGETTDTMLQSLHRRLRWRMAEVYGYGASPTMANIRVLPQAARPWSDVEFRPTSISARGFVKWALYPKPTYEPDYEAIAGVLADDQAILAKYST